MIMRMYHLIRSLAPLLILILISTACSGKGTEPVQVTTPTPPPVQIATEAASPTAIEEPVSSPTADSTPTAEPTTQPGLLYQDDFTLPDTGWPAINFDNYYVGYHEPEYYHVEVHAPNDHALVPVPDLDLADFTAEVEVFPELGLTAAEGDFRYGLVFRRAGEQYYAFTISPRTKTWSVLKSSPTGLEVLEEGQEETIQGLEAVDTLRVDARGPDFLFHINGQPVGQVDDADYTSGEVGVYVQTFDSTQAHIHYDLLTIWELQALPLEEGLLYQDDFTQLDSGWPAIAFDNSYIGYHEPEFYHVEVHAPNDKELVPVPDLNLDDFTAEVEVFPELGLTAAEGDFRYGLVFRRAGDQYYAFTISPRTQTWSVLKSSPEGLEILEEDQEDAIRGLESADRLRVDARGRSFFLHINDRSVSLINDADYTSGEVGFYVETFDSTQAHIHYDLLTIWEVQAPELACNVITEALNVRSGPGTRFGALTALELDAKFEPLERNQDGSWILVRLEDSDQEGWVSSLPNFIACNVSLEDLPVADLD
jgi:hypothetical protein